MCNAYEIIKKSQLPKLLAELRGQEDVIKAAKNKAKSLKIKLERMMRKGGE